MRVMCRLYLKAMKLNKLGESRCANLKESLRNDWCLLRTDVILVQIYLQREIREEGKCLMIIQLRSSNCVQRTRLSTTNGL